MALINHRTREIHFKIVYYGCGLCGKTTNLRSLHDRLPTDRRGKLISIATDNERTLFFDFLPIDLGTVNGFLTRFHLYTVPGQIYYRLSRRAVLQGVDGLVFVTDSHPAREQANREALVDLHDHLKVIGITGSAMARIPWVVQYNKRDLPMALPVERLRTGVNERNWPEFEAVANDGRGVNETLRSICKAVLARLAPTATPQPPVLRPAAPPARVVASAAAAPSRPTAAAPVPARPASTPLPPAIAARIAAAAAAATATPMRPAPAAAARPVARPAAPPAPRAATPVAPARPAVPPAPAPQRAAVPRAITPQRAITPPRAVTPQRQVTPQRPAPRPAAVRPAEAPRPLRTSRFPMPAASAQLPQRRAPLPQGRAPMPQRPAPAPQGATQLPQARAPMPQRPLSAPRPAAVATPVVTRPAAAAPRPAVPRPAVPRPAVPRPAAPAPAPAPAPAAEPPRATWSVAPRRERPESS